MVKISGRRFLISSTTGVLLISLLTHLVFPKVFSYIAFETTVIFKSFYNVKQKVVIGKDGWLFFQPELFYMARPLPLGNVSRIANFSKTLEAHGIKLIVVPVPNKLDIYPEKLTTVGMPTRIKRSRVVLFDKLKSSGVDVIDLVPQFLGAKDTCMVFNYSETHWTPKGIEIAAQVIADKLDPILKKRHIPQNTTYLTLDTFVRSSSDLLDKYTSPPKSHPFGYIDASPAGGLYELLPPAGEGWDGGAKSTSLNDLLPAKKVFLEDGALFEDDKHSEILILGDSFVNHGKWWSTQLGAHIAYLIKHPTRTYCSLLANTDGPCMYSHKPKIFPKNGIVVWVFTSRVLRNDLRTPSD